MTSLNDGALSTEPPAADEAPTAYTYPDWEWTNGVVANGPDGRPDPVRRVLTFTSAPLADDLEVTGPIVLKLLRHRTRSTPASSSSLPTSAAGRGRARKGRAARLHQRLEGLAARPRIARRTETRSTALRPFYTHTNPQPLTPGDIYHFDIEVLPTPTCSERVTASGWRSPTVIRALTDAVFTHPYHPTAIGTDTIHHRGAHPSCLLLPVVKS